MTCKLEVQWVLMTGATWRVLVEDDRDEAWHKGMNLNRNAPFSVTRKAAKRCMIARRRGRFVNVASVPGLKRRGPRVQTIAYKNAKAGATHLCQHPAAIGTDSRLVETTDGRIFWDGRLPRLSSTERSALHDVMNRAMAALHRVDPTSVGLGD